MNTVEVLDRWARERPEVPAIIDRLGRPISFLELRDAVGRGAAVFKKHGIGPGDRVVLLIPISVPLYLVLLAVLRVGAVATVFDPSAGLAHIKRCCERARPKAFIGNRKAHLLRLVSSAVRQIPLKFHLGQPEWVPFAISCAESATLAPADITHVENDAPALMTFTSGSTGLPKAAVRSHGLLAAQGEAVGEALELHAGEMALTTLPVFTLANLAAGVTTLIADADLAQVGAIEPKPVLNQLQQYRPQSVVASPAFLERLLTAGQGLPYLQRIYTGGAPVYPDFMRRLKEAAPQAEVVAVYGSTEAEPVAHIEWSEFSDEDVKKMRTGSGLLAGKPVSQVKLAIIPNTFGTPMAPLSEAQFSAINLPHGEAGEIVVTGEHVLKGYFEGVGDETTKFRVGHGTAAQVWHRTGDVGRLDEIGRLWLLGRAEAVLRDKQGNVLFPFAVEVAAREIPGVRRSALMAVSGKRVLAVEGDASEHAVKTALAWAALDEVRRVQAIPLDRRHNAKVDYPALRKLLGEGR